MDTAAAEVGLASGQLMFKSDCFCWVCHTKEPDFMWRCPTCPRSYHCGCCVKGMSGYPKPIVDRPGNTQEVPKFVMLECPECLVGKATFKSVYPTMRGRSQESVGQILNQACLALRKVYLNNPYIDILKVVDPEYIKTVGKVMDIQVLEEMIKQGQVATVEGFLGELKWIHHNSVIVDGATSPTCDQSKHLIEACRSELKAILACPDYYLSQKNKKSSQDNGWFLKACNPPHILAWAKYASFPWWPAKVRRIDGDTVNVLFFGDQTNADIPLVNCCLYSKKAPNSKKRKSDAMKKAINDINIHINELEKMHGLVVLATDWKSPMVKKLDVEGLRVMFPDYKE